MLRRKAAFVLTTPAILLFAGCGGSKSSMPPQEAADSITVQHDQADLDNVALCFHQAVTVLQAEPDTPKDIAIFMKEGQAAVDKFGSDSSKAVLHALRWNSGATSLITRSGEPIHCRVAKQTHDNYGPHGSEWITEYEFYIPDTNRTSRTTIQLTMGNWFGENTNH